MKRYIVERTNKAEIRPKELSEKTESCRGNSRDEIKGHKDRSRHKNRIKRSGQARLVCLRQKPSHPHHVKVSPRGPRVSRSTVSKVMTKGSNLQLRKAVVSKRIRQ